MIESAGMDDAWNSLSRNKLFLHLWVCNSATSGEFENCINDVWQVYEHCLIFLSCVLRFDQSMMN